MSVERGSDPSLCVAPQIIPPTIIYIDYDELTALPYGMETRCSLLHYSPLLSVLRAPLCSGLTVLLVYFLFLSISASFCVVFVLDQSDPGFP